MLLVFALAGIACVLAGYLCYGLLGQAPSRLFFLYVGLLGSGYYLLPFVGGGADLVSAVGEDALVDVMILVFVQLVALAVGHCTLMRSASSRGGPALIAPSREVDWLARNGGFVFVGAWLVALIYLVYGSSSLYQVESMEAFIERRDQGNAILSWAGGHAIS